MDHRQNNRMLWQCVSGIAQRPLHHAVAVPTDMQNRATMSIAQPLGRKKKEKRLAAVFILDFRPCKNYHLRFVHQWFISVLITGRHMMTVFRYMHGKLSFQYCSVLMEQVPLFKIIIILMYIYHALVNALSTDIMHINLNAIY